MTSCFKLSRLGSEGVWGTMIGISGALPDLAGGGSTCHPAPLCLRLYGPIAGANAHHTITSLTDSVCVCDTDNNENRIKKILMLQSHCRTHLKLRILVCAPEIDGSDIYISTLRSFFFDKKDKDTSCRLCKQDVKAAKGI